MSDPTPEQLRQASIEEASHAVAAHRAAWAIQSVTIEPTAERKGGTSLLPRDGDPLSIAVEGITISLVGALALEYFSAMTPEKFGVALVHTKPADLVEAFEEADLSVVLGFGGTCYGPPSSDELRAEAFATAVAATEPEKVMVLALGAERARTLVGDPVFRFSVDRLALFLRKRHTISGAEAIAAIERGTTT
jgi:hypothetical protein